MGAFFFGVLRSGSLDGVRAALRGLDVEVATLPTLPPYEDGSPTPTPAAEFGPEMMKAPGYLRLIIAETWPRAAWEHAATIARGESSFNPQAHNTNGEDSRGIWQINVVPQANIDLLSLGDMFDPRTNAQAAYIVWNRQGWRAWQNVATSLGVPLSGPGVP